MFLTAGVDVQRDRLECSIWAWGRGLESWLVDHIVIEAPPTDKDAWERLTEVLGDTYRHASGSRLGVLRMAVDTGYEGIQVYSWARQVGGARILPIKGMDGFDRSSPVTGPTYVDAKQDGKKVHRGARLWTVSVATFKSETYQWLRLNKPTDEDEEALPGYIHLPAGTNAEWVKQLVAEQLVTVRTKRGYSRREWQQMRERNEALDCRVYARAAAWIAGADRWEDAKWTVLEDQVRRQDRQEPETVSDSQWFSPRRESWFRPNV